MLEEWTIERAMPESILTAGHTYQLKNTHIDRYLISGEREYGINLVWSDTSFRDMFFAHNGPQGTPVTFGEPVAIAISDGGYLRYQEREWGINLGWSNDRIEEWLPTGGSTGATIPYENNQFGLYNTVAQDHVVYCRRSHGINLRWSSDCDRFDSPATTASVGMMCRIPLGTGGTEISFGSVTFSGQLTAPGGASDGATSFQRTDQWEALPTDPDGLANVSLTNLRPGTWRVEARTPLWVAVCNVELAAGLNPSVNFEQFSNGCARGFEYPSRGDRLLGRTEGIRGFGAQKPKSGADQ